MTIQHRTDSLLPGANKDEQTVSADWTQLQKSLIDGVEIHEVRNVLRDTSHLTEIFRQEWFDTEVHVDQVFQVSLAGHAVSAWHVHLDTLDRLFVATGQVKIALYDARDDSQTHGVVNEFRLGERRPALVIVPAGVWHGLRNMLDERATVLNLVDHAYEYGDPDHWRLPADTPEIPYAI